jgi:TetR/AcrR family tetracycline transcriptional repressor
VALTKAQIVDEAVALLDEGGLEAVTFRRLAERLGVRSPSLFWHIRNKALLLEAMAEAILAPAFGDIRPPEPGERWQDWLARLAERLRLTLLAHPDGARVLSSAQLSETMASISERAMVTLVEQGLPLRDARLVVLAVERFTVGHVLEEQAPRPDESVLAGFDLEAFTRRHPTVTAAIAEYFEPGRTVDDLFRDTLRVIID